MHTNGIESFWTGIKRAHKGVFHKLSPKHLNRYLGEFVQKHNERHKHIARQMQDTGLGLIGKELTYRKLIADNGLPSFARPALVTALQTSA